MMNKQYRYSNYVDNRVICESDWLLQASNSQGQIYDNLRKKFIEPHPNRELIKLAFNIKCSSSFFPDKQPLSIILAMAESSGLTEILFSEETEENLLYSSCINPEVEVIFIGD